MPDFLRQGLLSERINAMSPSGPSSFDKGYADSEAIEERRMDEASEQGGGVDWEKLGSKQQDPFKTNYSHSDELGPDSEALEEAAMDQASEGLLDPAAMKSSIMSNYTARSLEKPLGVDPMLDAQIMDKGNVGEAEGAIEGLLPHKSMSADHIKMMGPQYQHQAKTPPKIDESESALDRIGMDNMLNEELGPDRGEKRGTPIDEATGKYLGDNQFGVLGEKLSGAYDSVKDWFGSGGEDSAEDKAGKKQLGAALMKGALGGGGAQPPGGRMSMPTSKTVRGQVAFPGLLNKPKRQKNPYFMPKGLV